IPMGACLFRGKAAGVFAAGDHQSTFAGNPLACRAAITVLETLQKPGFYERVQTAGQKIRDEISSWKNPLVVQVRGKGLMIGVQIKEGVKPFDIEVECMKSGLCVSTAGSDVVRFLPPLVISDKEIGEGLKIFKSVLEKF
ncbi:MAG: aminotransferase class III-fold pyridoxal phosphate-dependent enzyme, partial [Treponema sp.]|nr:aminotransferase class III-fold pyridoxal phosphate-dependent enzyme [Treponema sp.]